MAEEPVVDALARRQPDDAAVRPAARRPAAVGAWAGAIGGFAVGLGDVVSSWGRVGQFLPGAGGKLGLALHVGALYAAAGAVAAAIVVAGALALVRWTVLGPLLRHGLERHREARARDPRQALAGLSLAIAGLPCVGLALAVAYRAGFQTISQRQHEGLVVAVVIAATLAALAAAAVATLALGRLVELGLRAAARGRVAAALSHPAAPAAAVAALAALGGAVAWVAFRKPLSLDQLQLRPYAVAALAALAAAAAWPAAAAALGAVERLPRAARRAAAPGLPVLLLALALVSSGSAGVRKAAAAYTGLGGRLAGGIRAIVDLDRDGYSALLGGGDCDDLDGTIHPGAFDVPDDGVDQNCLGGDLRLARSPEDARFVAVPPAVPPDFNVLFITLDTVRADHVGAYGYGRPTTPTLDAIAAEGALFVNGWAHAPSTRYSIPAILTGRYPSQVLWDPNARGTIWWPGLQLENRTIAELMKERGLTTGAILNYHYFEKVRRMDQGFDTYDNSNARLHSGSDPASTSGTSSREQADAAIRWIDERKDRRWFLWVHFYDPHYRYERHPGTAEFGDDPIALYDHEIRFTDDQIGRVVARLKELGLWERTVVVVTGDHGEGFGERRIDFHGYHLYATQTKVPYVVRVPGLPPRRVTTPAGHVDLLPTLANLVGGAPEAFMTGRSLLGEIAGLAPDEDREIFQEVSFEGPTDRRGVATRRWHLLYNMVPDNTWELYDLEADPGETRDLWGARDVDDLVAKLKGWIDSLQFPPGASEILKAALLAERPSPALPLRADFGGAVRLLGLDLGAREARPGDAVPITWYWESLKRLDGDWIVFVHFEGPTRFQGDHPTVGGVLPISRWRRGQLVADRHAVTVPPHARPGEYTIWAGIWKPNQNLPISNAGAPVDGRNRLRVGTLRVLPPSPPSPPSPSPSP